MKDWPAVFVCCCKGALTFLVSHLVVRTCRRSWSEELGAYIGAMELAHLKSQQQSIKVNISLENKEGSGRRPNQTFPHLFPDRPEFWIHGIWWSCLEVTRAWHTRTLARVWFNCQVDCPQQNVVDQTLSRSCYHWDWGILNTTNFWGFTWS